MELTDGHYRYMNIGRRFWRAELFELNDNQRKAIAPYVHKLKGNIVRGVGVFMYGTNGTGKSYVAAALCKEVWRRWRVTSYCVTASELKAAWIQDKPAEEGSEETLLERCESVRFLVIDDLGKEHRTQSGFTETKLGELLRARVREMKTTCVTSNLNPKQFADAYGPSSRDLALESLIPVALSGRSLRKVD